MTKKQQKKLAKEIAECERIIHQSTDKIEIREAMDRQVKLISNANMDISDTIAVDQMTKKFLEEMQV